MKKMCALALACVPLLLFAACGGAQRLPVQPTQTDDTSAITQAQAEKPPVGLWQSVDAETGEPAARYALYGDGTFIFEPSAAQAGDRVLYQTGTWSVSGAALRLEVEYAWVLPVGSTADMLPDDRLTILEGGLVKVAYDPAEAGTRAFARTGTDTGTGRDTITLDEAVFYNYDDEPGLLDDFYALPAEPAKTDAGE